MNNKRGIALISLLLLTLVGIVSFGVISDNKLKRKNQEEYNEWLKEKKQESVLGVSEKTEEEKSDFYTKILLKEKVNILIIGDRIALSDGRDSQNGIWSEGIKYILNKNYGVNSEVKILAESTDSIDKALVYANSNIIGNYDLIIMCYGYNDSLGSTDLNKFKYIYNQAIKKAKENNESSVKMILVPSNISKDNNYRKAIIDIGNENSINIIDPKEIMDLSGKKENTYLNGDLPNDIGYQIYTQAIEKAINEELSKR